MRGTCTHALTDHAAAPRHTVTVRLYQEPQPQLWQQRGAWTTQLSRVRIPCPCPCSPSMCLHLIIWDHTMCSDFHRLFIGGVRDATRHKLCGSERSTPCGNWKVSPQEKLMTSPLESTSHGIGNGGGRGHSRARSAMCGKRQEKRLRQCTRGGGGTREKSSGGRSDHGDAPWNCATLQTRARHDQTKNKTRKYS